MTVVAVIDAKKVCHVSVCDHVDATSSSAKSRPPTGAPKAEATPAAAPAVRKSRASFGLRKCSKKGSAQPRVRERICETPRPTIAPMWIMGPSGPTGRPEPTAKTHETNLIASVFTLKILRWCVPLR